MTVVDPDALEHDASECFIPWSETLEKLKADYHAPAPVDFSIIPGADTFREDYQSAAKKLLKYASDGAKAFDAFAQALLETALEYDKANGASQADIDRLQKELEEL